MSIVTDSTCDLPVPTLQRLSVTAVPFRVIIGDEVYRDGREIDPPTLYDWMSHQGVFPSVSPPDTEDFIEVYKNLLKHSDTIVSIHVSGKLSSTLECAREAVHSLGAEDRVHLIDSGATTAALAEMVAGAALHAQRGLNAEQVCWAAERIRDELHLLYSPASLHWVNRESRLGKTLGLFAKFRRLRPIYTLRNGTVDTAMTCKQNGIIGGMIAQLKERFGQRPIRVVIALASSDSSIESALKDRFLSAGLNLASLRFQLIGPALGVHLGPGSLAICAHPDVQLDPPTSNAVRTPFPSTTAEVPTALPSTFLG
ncbi:MAG: DegV family protein [Trueperaceae bacterium]|nr:MAG: DegV family protein [Trueperaceae bacterium]